MILFVLLSCCLSRRSSGITKGIRTRDLAAIVDDYNSDRPTRASMVFMKRARVPKAVTEEDQSTNGYLRCRPFVVSRRELRSVIYRYVQAELFRYDQQQTDAALLGYAMLPNGASLSDIDKLSTNDDEEEQGEEMIGVTQPAVKSGTEVLSQESPMAALVAKHLKLLQPERLRLHLRAKPKIPLCRNTVVLI